MPAEPRAGAVDAPILMWHHIGDPPNAGMRPWAVPPALLEAQLDALAGAGYQAVTFEQLQAGDRPERPVVLTFDDGYTSFLDVASPALLAREMRAVLFVVAGAMGGVNDWDPGSRSLKLLDAGGVWTVAQQGHELGVHGWRHRPMTGVDTGALERELLAARTALEELARRPVRTMSYPNGEADERVVRAVTACGFELACLDWRPPDPDWDPAYGLLRVDVGPDTDPATLLRHLEENVVTIPRRVLDPVAAFEALVARTLDAAGEADPMAGWAAVHRASEPLAGALRVRGVRPRRTPFATIAEAGAAAGGTALASAVAAHTRELDARHDRHHVVPVWGAATPEAARRIPPAWLTLGPLWSDPVRHLWDVEPADHPSLVQRLLREAGAPARRRHVRAVVADLPVVETALLAAEAQTSAAETDVGRPEGDWAGAEAAFARVDVATVAAPVVDRVAASERSLLVRAVAALVRQDLHERYRGSWLGIGWAVMQPVLLFAVLAVFFGRVVDVGVDRYPEFLLSGLVVWIFLQRAVGESPGAVRGRGDLLRLSPFPRLALPLATVGSAAVDLVAQLAIVAPVLVAGAGPSWWRLAALPPLVVLAVAGALAAALVVSGLSVRYRDVGHLIPLLLSLLFYAVPVVYPVSLVPEAWQGAYRANPLAVVVELFRAVLYGGPWPPAWSVALCTAVAVAGLLAAMRWFDRAADRFVAEA